MMVAQEILQSAHVIKIKLCAKTNLSDKKLSTLDYLNSIHRYWSLL